MEYRIACTKCRHIEKENAFRCSRCNSILEVKIDYSSVRLGKKFTKEKPSGLKYLPFFPINKFHVKGGEGGTEMVRKMVGPNEILLKIETKNPTMSFKDRGSAVEINKAKELKAQSVVCASTGNMGISVARYAKLAKIGATIFISKNADRKKMALIKKHGAALVEVNGDFNASCRMAEKFAQRTGAFMCGDYHLRKEGQKSLMFEVIDQLRYNVPDFVFVSVGNATLLAAMYKALLEYKKFKLIRKFPKLVAVQSDKCDPLVNAYNSGKRIEYMKPRTMADAIAVGYPTFGLEGIIALKKTSGIALKVSEDQINDAVLMLSGMGIGAETGGAAAFAGYMKLYEENRGALSKKRTVIVISGNN